MKKVLISACAMLLVCSISAQKYSFKKGKLSIDDVPVAKYDGKGGFFKYVSISITTLDGKPLMSVKETDHDFKNPFFMEAKRWMHIEFANGKTMAWPMKTRMLEKLMLDTLFRDGTPALFSATSLNEETVNNLIAARHYDFRADSLVIAKMEEENKVRLTKIMPRDLSQPVTLVPQRQTDRAVIVYDVYQAEMHLGQIHKMMEGFGQGYKYSYSAWLKSDPYQFNGAEQRFSPIAYFKSASDTFDNDVIMMKDKSVVKFKTPGAVVGSAEHSFAKMLIAGGHL